MGLSEHEQRLLEEMERSLYASEADSLETSNVAKNRPSYRAVVVAVISVVAGIVALIAAVSFAQIWLGVVGFIVMLAGVLFASSPKNQVQASATTEQPVARESFAEKAQRRWEERLDGER